MLIQSKLEEKKTGKLLPLKLTGDLRLHCYLP